MLELLPQPRSMTAFLEARPARSAGQPSVVLTSRPPRSASRRRHSCFLPFQPLVKTPRLSLMTRVEQPCWISCLGKGAWQAKSNDQPGPGAPRHCHHPPCDLPIPSPTKWRRVRERGSFHPKVAMSRVSRLSPPPAQGAVRHLRRLRGKNGPSRESRHPLLGRRCFQI